MKRQTTAIALLWLLLCAWPLRAQERPALTAQPNTIYVSAEGKFESAPDTALMQFTIAAQEESSEAAYQRAAQAAERVRQALRANSIDPKLAELSFYSLQPVQDWRNPKHRIVAYRVVTSVSLKLKDFSKTGPLSQQFAAIEETENQQLSYLLDRMEEAKSKAVEDAFQRARASAAAVARAGGRSLGEISYASVDVQEQVRITPMMGLSAGVAQMARAEAPPAPTEGFSPQKISITARVNALFNLK